MVKYIHTPSGLLEIIYKTNKMQSSNHKKTSYRLTWTLCADFAASYLKSIAPDHPGAGYEHVTLSDVRMTMTRDESGENCPLLPLDTYQANISSSHFQKLRDERSLEEYATDVLDTGLNKVTLHTPVPIPDTGVSFLRSAFDLAQESIEASIEKRRLMLLNFNTELPNGHAFTTYFDAWRQQQLEGVYGRGAAVKPTLFFEGDIAMFRFVNSISGYDQGTELIKRLGLHVVRYSKRLAEERKDLQWYFANPHGDEFVWLYHGLQPSDAKDVVKGLRDFLFERPFFIKRTDNHETIELPLILTMGWAPLSISDGLDFKSARALAHKKLNDHKVEDHALSERLYPESRHFNRRADDTILDDL